MSEIKLKYLVKTIKTGLNPRSNFVLNTSDSTCYYVTTKNIDGLNVVLDDKCDRINEKATRKINERSDLRKDDILFSGIGTIGRTAYISETPQNWNVSESLYSLRSNQTLIYPKFLFYVLNCHRMEDYYRHYQTGSAQKGLRIVDLKNFMFDLPEKEKQMPIVNFLDNKCSTIDEMITKEESEVEELKKYKFSIISNSVRHGLKGEKQKLSHYSWIESYPGSWSLGKIGALCYLKGRIGWQGLTASEYQEAGPYLITGTDFISGKINWETCEHITEKRYEEAAPIKIKNGDLLITKDGTVGKVAIVNDLIGKASLNSGVLLIRGLTNSYINKYLYYVLNSSVFWSWFEKKQKGNSTIVHLYQEQFNGFLFPLPSKDEQELIVTYLDGKCTKIDELISIKEEKIETLKAYKKSLIYECVTGKKEIPYAG